MGDPNLQSALSGALGQLDQLFGKGQGNELETLRARYSTADTGAAVAAQPDVASDDVDLDGLLGQLDELGQLEVSVHRAQEQDEERVRQETLRREKDQRVRDEQWRQEVLAREEQRRRADEEREVAEQQQREARTREESLRREQLRQSLTAEEETRRQAEEAAKKQRVSAEEAALKKKEEEWQAHLIKMHQEQAKKTTRSAAAAAAAETTTPPPAGSHQGPPGISLGPPAPGISLGGGAPGISLGASSPSVLRGGKSLTAANPTTNVGSTITAPAAPRISAASRPQSDTAQFELDILHEDLTDFERPDMKPYLEKAGAENDFEELEILGKGGFGQVTRVKHAPTGFIFAMKHVDLGNPDVYRELNVMENFAEPWFVNYYGSIRLPRIKKELVLIEYCGLGSCMDLMKLTARPFTEEEISFVCKYTLRALSSMARHDYIHRDIKSDNLLINNRGAVKVADFGAAVRMRNSFTPEVEIWGTYWFMAPEVVSGQGYTTKADVWSLGITALELAEGNCPRHLIGPPSLLEVIYSKPAPTFRNPARWSPEFRSFINCALTKNAAERPTASNLLQHEFITGNKQQHVFQQRVNECAQLKEELRLKGLLDPTVQKKQDMAAVKPQKGAVPIPAISTTPSADASPPAVVVPAANSASNPVTPVPTPPASRPGSFVPAQPAAAAPVDAPKKRGLFGSRK